MIEHDLPIDLQHAVEPGHVRVATNDAETTGVVVPRLGREVWRDPLLRRMLAVADVLVAGLVALVWQLAGYSGWIAVALLPMWIILAKLHGLYDRDQRALRHLTVDELPSIFTWTAICTTLLALSGSLVRGAPATLRVVVGVWLIAAASSAALRGLMRHLWRRLTRPDRAIVVGEGLLAEAVCRKLQLFPDIHAELVSSHGEVSVDDIETDALQLDKVDRVIVASLSIDEDLIAALVAFCRRNHVKLSVIPPARGLLGTAVRLSHVADLPIVEYNTWDTSRSTLLLKKAIDVIGSSIALLLVLPIFAVVALAIKLDSRGPVIFSQLRAGRLGRPFAMYKFRTMVENAEEALDDLVRFDDLEQPMFKLHDDPRVTRVGRFLRRMSLDELPQLINVLKGDMSLVGPRPEQVELVARYAPEHMFRVSVRPGLTGPMQVYGRGQLSFEERLAVEREYIENLSVGRDLRFLAMTIGPVLSGHGAR